MPRLLSKRETAEIVGFHPEHVMRLARAGKFPRPIKLGGAPNCTVRFIADEVDAWIVSRIAVRASSEKSSLPLAHSHSNASH
jgi:predicted DNA-binding transcriptional regulator AlpA